MYSLCFVRAQSEYEKQWLALNKLLNQAFDVQHGGRARKRSKNLGIGSGRVDPDQKKLTLATIFKVLTAEGRSGIGDLTQASKV
jgi:hypothetical protein